MKFLLDMPVSPSLAEVLSRFGHEGVHVQAVGHAKSADSDVIEFARSEDRVIVTADLDFPRILFLSSSFSPGMVLFRGANYSDEEMRGLLTRVLQEVDEATLRSSICVVDKRRIRITELPLKRG